MRASLTAILIVVVASACQHRHRVNASKAEVYTAVGARPDNAAKATPPSDLATAAIAVGAAAPAIGDAGAGHKHLVVVFYRGDWCPYCRAQLEELQAHADDFATRDAAVVAVSVDSAETSAHLAEGLALRFPLVSDPGHRIIAAYGVFDGETEIAWPAMFVVDDGKVAWRWLADTFRERIATSDVLAAIDALSAGPSAPRP